MTALAAGTKIPTAKFPVVGSKVKGRIIALEDYQCRDFNNANLLKWWSKEGKPVGLPIEAATGLKPVWGVKVTLETDVNNPRHAEQEGDPETRVNLFIESPRMMKAVKAAFTKAGDRDLNLFADLEVLHSGLDGAAKEYMADYTSYDPFAA